ncbi:short-chain dehydrogenase TIC 32 B, chloroplastic-like isoform X1 [Panicum virgatum]|uniref:short-chain dehydrogenase TIC 32 B, chloroplastic-like isoform X1 n=1 Tax=Panicum virgatum TaxID=38727 RepID=UPI0019D59313|nr:short-chain dehydrogenase TIC 32 B, chloroplastic-like isoform X1 [Panicum virgatum]
MLQAVRYLLGSPGATGFGSKSTAEDVTAACPDLAALTAIITGATSGIGAETARVLAKRGARVVIPARSVKAAEDMRARIRDECPGADVLVLPLDLSSLASVRAFADRFLELGLPLHLLINNAGKFSHGQLALSEDGVEMTFATNYLGHFLLTKLLLGRMAETAAATGVQGRIVNVSSSVHGWFAGDWAEYLDLVTRRKIAYDATQAYAVSKLANVLHTRELAARLQETGANVTVNCVHPGIVRTRLNRDRDGILTGTHCHVINYSLIMHLLPLHGITFLIFFSGGVCMQIWCSCCCPSCSRRSLRLRRPRATWRPTRGWPACPAATSPTATRRCRRRPPPTATRPRGSGASPRP